jgi:peptidyl-prolyl cis-trans isomerase C
MTVHKTLILWIAGLAFAAGALCQPADQTPADINPVVMRINGESVYAVEISLVMRNLGSQLPPQEESVAQQQLLQAATQQVVEQKLLAQEARRFGIQADEARVTARMNAAEKQSGGREALARTLAGGGSTLEQLEGMFRELELGREFITNQILPTVQVTDQEVEEVYSKHPEVFTSEERVRARHILIQVDEGSDSDAERNALERALQAHERAVAGEDFAALARELSDGPSGPNGGDLGFFTKSTMVEPVAEAAFGMAPGEVSDVVRTRFGYHVIKVEERRPAGAIPFEEAQGQARSLLINQRTAELVGELLETLYSNAQIEEMDAEGPATTGTTDPESPPQ